MTAPPSTMSDTDRIITIEMYGSTQCAICGRSNANFVVETYYRGTKPEIGHYRTVGPDTPSPCEPNTQFRDPIRVCGSCIRYIAAPGGALDEMIERGQDVMP